MSVPPQLPLAAPTMAKPENSEMPSAGLIHPAQTGSTPAAPAPVWLQRLSLGVLVIFCLYLGLLIAVLPWWRDMWDRNALLLRHPSVHAFLIKGPVRGLISGLGVLDLWIGISELIHYRDYRN
jgi:hypothetical protein